MPLKLIYTSAPRLLQAGRSGFGTVAMSRNIPFQAVKLAEECSKFSRQSGLSAERVVYSYRTVRCSDGFWHILSCLRDAGTDYSGRTNHLAQHLMFDSREASACAWEGKTPAGVILGTAWPDHDGFCGWIEDGVYWDALEPEPTWQWWGHYAGSGDCRRSLSSEAALRGAVFVYGRGLEIQTAENAKKVLCLYAESQADCPDHGWGVTFTTSLEPNDEASEFRWIGVAENSPMLPKVEAAGGRVRVTFDMPPPPSCQPESKRPSSEVMAPDASQGASLQQEIYEGVGAGRKVQGYGAKPPPLGSPTPPRPDSRAPENAALPWIKDNPNYLVFAVVLLLAIVAGSLLIQSSLVPAEVRFKPDSLVRTYSPGQTDSAVLEQPSNGEVTYAKHGSGNWSTNPPSEAGDYDLRVKAPRWFGFASKIYEFPKKLKVNPAPATISFMQTNFVANGSNQVVPAEILPPEAREESVVEYRKSETNQRGENTNVWTKNTFSLQGVYEARVRISGNYQGVGQTGFLIAADHHEGVTGSSTAALADNAGTVPSPSAGGENISNQTSPVPQASSVRFLLADKSKVLSLLTNRMPTNGMLNVVRCDDSGQSVKIDRTTGSWGGFGNELFIMKGLIPVDKIPKDEAPIDVDGPLAYIVADGKIPSFVAIELLPGDNSGVMQRFFQGVHLETKQDKPRIQFSLNDAGGRVSLDQFVTEMKGERFVLEITEHPYDETTPLKLYFAPNGELVVNQERDKLTRELAKAAADKDAQATAKTPWDQAKSELLKPLKETLSQKSPDPRAEALVKSVEGIAQPSGGTSHTNATMLVGALIAETFRVLETDAFTKSLVQLSKNRTNEKEKKKKPGSGSESLSSIMDVSLLTPQEWIERLQTDKNSATNWKTKAIEWIRGREEDVKANKGDEKDQKTVTAILGGLSQGIRNVKLPTVNERNNAQTVQKDNIDPEVRIQEKLDFLKILGSPSSSDSRPKKGRLLLVTDKSQGSVASTNILWPNVLLFNGPVQEAIKR
jgi:hypothetical protein